MCVVVALGACASNVSQDRATGPDGRIKGARPLVLEDGEGQARDVVTYPGGDRVDWKSIVLPEGKRGRLALKMTFATPRPGLRVSFDVFDQWNQPVAGARGGRGRIRAATITNARGTYFVRVYAPRRGDAGAYKLSAEFVEDVVPTIPDPRTLEIPDPPRLPAVPEPASTCAVFSASDPVCQDACPPGAPPNWKGCQPPPPPPPTTCAVFEATNPVCASVCAPGSPATWPACIKPPEPVVARVLTVGISSRGLEVTVGAGTESGITKTWKANVLRGTTDALLSGGSAKVIRVNKRTTVLEVNVTADLLRENPMIRLAP